MKLSGKTVIVTGAGRKIGRAIAREFARENAQVVCTARTKGQIEAVARDIREEGGHAVAVPCDVTKREQVEAMVVKAVEAFGKVDILMNNAGGFFQPGQLVDIDPKEWVWVYEANVFGTMYCCRAVLPMMMERKEGRIINMYGGGAFGPAPHGGSSSYGSAKAAICQFTEHLALQLEPYNIQVNSIGPGSVPSDEKWSEFDAYESAHGKPHPDSIGRSRPTGAAQLCVFLSLKETAFITGRHLSVTDDYEALLDEDPEELRKSNRFKMRRLA